MSERDDLQKALEMARRSVAMMEEQAAGYGSLAIPPHLQIQLEDKRRDVIELEARLAALQVPAPPISIPTTKEARAALERAEIFRQKALETRCSGDFKPAVEEYRQVIAQEPDDPDHYYRLAIALHNWGACKQPSDKSGGFAVIRKFGAN